MLQGVIGLLLVGLGAALMFALKPRDAVSARLRAIPAFDVVAPLIILVLFIIGGLLLAGSATGVPSTLSPQTISPSLKGAAQ